MLDLPNMGLFSRRALARSQRLIAPFAQPGEKASDFDVGLAGRLKVDLIATDLALYVYPSAGGEIVRLPFDELTSVMWTQLGRSDWALAMTHGDKDLAIEIRAPRSLGQYVRRQVELLGRTQVDAESGSSNSMWGPEHSADRDEFDRAWSALFSEDQFPIGFLSSKRGQLFDEWRRDRDNSGVSAMSFLADISLALSMGSRRDLLDT